MQIPKGEMDVEGTAFDLRSETKLGDRVPQVGVHLSCLGGDLLQRMV